MAISRNEVEKVSLLARLRFSEEELGKMTSQMGTILEYFALLQQVDTEEVEPMAHSLDLSDVFRPDEVGTSLDRERALAAAPHRDAECYLVPAVLGQ